MKNNNKALYALIGMVVFVISKMILGHIGIQNIPVPIIITILLISYIMFFVGIFKNKKFNVGEKKYYIIVASLLAILFIIGIVLDIFLRYFPEKSEQYKILLLIIVVLGILIFIALTIIAIMIKQKYHRQ